VREIITKEQASRFYDNYKYVHFTLPDTKDAPLVSNFLDKMCYSLYQLVGLIKDGKTCLWDRNGIDAYHSWLAVEDGEIIYDTKGRRDDFCQHLYNTLLRAYTSDDFMYYYHTLLPSEEHKRNVKSVIAYYKTTQYYSHYVKKYNTLGYLSKHDWERISQNKYSVAVLNICNSEPVFEVGELVLPRASFTSHDKANRLNIKVGIKDKPRHIMILTNDENIVNAVKGGRRYKVVGMGGTNSSPIYVEERYMKKNRKSVNKKKQSSV